MLLGILDSAEFIILKSLFVQIQISALQEQYHKELKMELQGEQYSSVSNAALNIETSEASAPDNPQIDEDVTNMSKVIMTRKKRKLYEAMKVVFRLYFSCIYLVLFSNFSNVMNNDQSSLMIDFSFTDR